MAKNGIEEERVNLDSTRKSKNQLSSSYENSSVQELYRKGEVIFYFLQNYKSSSF